jgi:hypothetical protein
MATSLQYAIPGSFAQTFTAAGTLAAGQLVKMHSVAGQVVACSAATDPFIGVVQSDGAVSTEPVSIVTFGPAYILCGGAIPASGVAIGTSDSAGAAVVWTASGSKKQCVKITDYTASLTTAAGDLVIGNVLGGNVVD